MVGKMLTQIYNSQVNNKKKPKEKKEKEEKEEGGEKKKREPTAYNLFVKEKMPLVKEEFPDLTRQDLMRKVGEMWKATKE